MQCNNLQAHFLYRNVVLDIEQCKTFLLSLKRYFKKLKVLNNQPFFHFSFLGCSKMPAFLNVVDIACLVKGAEGPEKVFLSHISACDLPHDT